MVHFTVGQSGKAQLCQFFNKNEIEYHLMKGDGKGKELPSWFRVISRSIESSKNSTYSETVDQKLKTVASTIIPELLKVRNGKLNNSILSFKT